MTSTPAIVHFTSVLLTSVSNWRLKSHGLNSLRSAQVDDESRRMTRNFAYYNLQYSPQHQNTESLMAKKKSSGNSDRSNPSSNKSLAIRTVLAKMPNAKASEVAIAVKKEFGHDVGRNMIYMVKTKSNMASDGRAKRTRSSKSGTADSPLTSAALWVDAIKLARQLLKSTGSVANATALLKALADK
jgi:hypothetical protein